MKQRAVDSFFVPTKHVSDASCLFNENKNEISYFLSRNFFPDFFLSEISIGAALAVGIHAFA